MLVSGWSMAGGTGFGTREFLLSFMATDRHTARLLHSTPRPRLQLVLKLTVDHDMDGLVPM